MRQLILIAAMISLAGPANARDQRAVSQPPLPVVLTLDTSGSMNEKQRFPMLLASLAGTMAILPDGTRVGVVTFNHEPRVVFPLTTLDDDTRRNIVETCMSLRIDGGTNIIAGVSLAQQMLEGAGTVICLSDGAQTDSTGKLVPESSWGPALDKLHDPRRVVHTIALGADADVRLLQRLADHHNGQLHRAGTADELLDVFLDIASRLGAFWRRSEAGGFDVKQKYETVIAVSTTPSPRNSSFLFRQDDDRRTPVIPTFTLTRSGIEASRFQLTPGAYQFAPGVGKTHILRPMPWRWAMPPLDLCANRANVVSATATATSTDAIRDELVVTAKIGDKTIKSTAQGTNDPSISAFPIPIEAGRSLTKAPSITLRAEQRGWFHVIGTWNPRLVNPDPMLISAEFLRSGSWHTWGDQTDLIIGELKLAFTPLKQVRGALEIVAPDGAVVAPERIPLDEQSNKAVQIKLTRKIPPKSSSASVTGSLSFRANTDDVVQALVNGAATWEVPIAWTHHIPTINIDESTDREVAIARGEERQVALGIRTRDVDFMKPAPRLEITNRRLPAGIALGWSDPDLSASDSVVIDSARMKIQIAPDMLPGKYEAEFSLQSSPPGILINGADVLTRQIVIQVPPIKTNVSLEDTEPGPWIIHAPTTNVTRRTTVVVRSADNGPLPSLSVRPKISGPVAVRALREEQRPTESRTVFELEVPAQTAPVEAFVSFNVVGVSVHADRSPDIAVSVVPIRLHPVAEPVRLPHYRGFRERLFGWLRPSFGPHVQVQVDGDGWEAAAGRYTLIEAGQVPDKGNAWYSDRVAIVPVKIAEHQDLFFESSYHHAQWLNGPRIPVAIESVEVPVPPWQIAVVLGLIIGALFSGLMLIRSCIIRARTDKRLLRAFGRMDVGRAVRLARLKIRLRRWPFLTTRITRSCRDRSDYRVAVNLGFGARDELRPGSSLPITHGDVVVVESPDGKTLAELTLCNGKKTRTPANARIHPSSSLFSLED